MLNRVTVDFQKQTVDPVQVSFNMLDRSQMLPELLLTISVTEVRIIRGVLLIELSRLCAHIGVHCSIVECGELKLLCLLQRNVAKTK